MVVDEGETVVGDVGEEGEEGGCQVVGEEDGNGVERGQDGGEGGEGGGEGGVEGDEDDLGGDGTEHGGDVEWGEGANDDDVRGRGVVGECEGEGGGSDVDVMIGHPGSVETAEEWAGGKGGERRVDQGCGIGGRDLEGSKDGEESQGVGWVGFVVGVGSGAIGTGRVEGRGAGGAFADYGGGRAEGGASGAECGCGGEGGGS